MNSGKTILQLVYDLNAIAIERNKIEMGLLMEPDNKALQTALDALNDRHDAIIYELCGRIPNLEGDKNLIPIKKRRLEDEYKNNES